MLVSQLMPTQAENLKLPLKKRRCKRKVSTDEVDIEKKKMALQQMQMSPISVAAQQNAFLATVPLLWAAGNPLLHFPQLNLSPTASALAAALNPSAAAAPIEQPARVPSVTEYDEEVNVCDDYDDDDAEEDARAQDYHLIRHLYR